MIGILALDRYFTDFSDQPPHIAFAVFLGFLGMLFIAFHPLTLKWVREIPQRWLIGLQSFRIVIEILLYFLYRDGLLPRAMTIEGWNFDLLIGLSAPVVAWYVHREHVARRGCPRFVAVWNVFGLLMLTNILVRGILSMPTKFQVFTDPPGNIVMAYFPWIWIPTFVVPLAYLLHILSLRREWAFSDREYNEGLDSDLGNSTSVS